MRPLITGIALKERTVRDYTRLAQRAGFPVDPAAIERLAAADCDLADRVDADARPAAKAAKPDPVKAAAVEAEKSGELDRLAAEAGTSIVRDQRKVVRKRLAALHAVPKPHSRWSNAVARMARIIAGATPSTNRRAMVSTCECPDLAWEILRIQAWLITRHVPPRFGDELNPFYGLTDRDFVGKFQRLVEDVCDKSTGRLGSWRTPK